jgi:hypothetical protein
MWGILLSSLVIRTHAVHPRFMFGPSASERSLAYYGLC